MKCPSEHASEDEPSRKKTHTWIDQDVDTEAIRNGKKLTDCHVGFAQQLLKRQFPVFSQQSCKQRRPSGSRNLYLTNFRWYILVETTGFLHWTLAAQMVMWTYMILYTDQLIVITQLFQSSAVKITKAEGWNWLRYFCHSYSYCSCSWDPECIQFRPISNETAPSKLFQGTFDDSVSIYVVIIRMNIIQLYIVQL